MPDKRSLITVSLTAIMLVCILEAVAIAGLLTPGGPQHSVKEAEVCLDMKPVVDIKGAESVPETSETARIRADTDGPVFGTVHYSRTTTGEPMEFAALVTDSGTVSEVYLNYTLENGTFNLTAVNHTGDRWNFTITAPLNQLFFPYHFSARDDSGNWNRTGEAFAQVTDDDDPEFNFDLTEGTPTTGDTFLIKAAAEDNIGITTMKILYFFNVSWPRNETLALHGDGYWFRSVYVPEDAVQLRYSFYMSDAAGNVVTTGPSVKDVTDDDGPEFDIPEPGIPITGDNFTISIETDDNRGIRSVVVMYSFNGTYLYGDLSRTRGAEWEMEVAVPIDATFLAYSFKITDVSGNVVDSEPANITVIDIIDPVAVPILPQSADQHDLVVLNGSASSDNIGFFNYTWSFTDEFRFKRYYEPVVEYRFHEPGTYRVTLNVTDLTGNWDAETVSITIDDVTPPGADAGKDRKIGQGDQIVLDAGGSTDNVGITSYVWKFDVAGDEKTLTGQAVYQKFYTPGDYYITLTVTDAAGNADTDVVRVTVGDTIPPTPYAGDNRTVVQGTEVTFDASRSSDNVGIRSYYWKFEYLDDYETLTGMGSSFLFGVPGKYLVELTIEDLAGNSAKDSLTITVLDTMPPVPRVILGSREVEAGRTYRCEAPQTIRLDAKGSTDNIGSIDRYHWSFYHAGSVEDRYGAMVEHRLKESGRYNISLHVSDAAGNSDYLNFSVDIEEDTLLTDPGGGGENTDTSFADQNYLWVAAIMVILLLIIAIALYWYIRGDRVKEKKVKIMRVKRRVRKRRARPKKEERIDPRWMEEYEMGMYDIEGSHSIFMGVKEAGGDMGPPVVVIDDSDDEMEDDGMENDGMMGGMMEDMVVIDEESLTRLEMYSPGTRGELVVIDPDETGVPVDGGELVDLFEGMDGEPGADVDEPGYVKFTPLDEHEVERRSAASGKDVVMALATGQIRQVEDLLRGMGRDEVTEMMERGLDIEKKACPSCGALIDDFWAVCPRCKMPV